MIFGNVYLMIAPSHLPVFASSYSIVTQSITRTETSKPSCQQSPFKYHMSLFYSLASHRFSVVISKVTNMSRVISRLRVASIERQGQLREAGYHPALWAPSFFFFWPLVQVWEGTITNTMISTLDSTHSNCIAKMLVALAIKIIARSSLRTFVIFVKLLLNYNLMLLL